MFDSVSGLDQIAFRFRSVENMIEGGVNDVDLAITTTEEVTTMEPILNTKEAEPIEVIEEEENDEQLFQPSNLFKVFVP